MTSSRRLMFAVFRSRPSLALLLIYQALFLNVVLPGHTRGEVTLDGKHTAVTCCCCCSDGALAAGKGPAAPSQRDKDNCALCQFMAGLTPVPVVSLTLPELGLLKLMPVPPPAFAVARQLIPTYLACGPPLSAARFSV